MPDISAARVMELRKMSGQGNDGLQESTPGKPMAMSNKPWIS